MKTTTQDSPTRSAYITALGYRRLQDESRELWQRRQVVTQALAAAAAEGDRSENAEYIYRKKELRELDRRIRYLQKRLPQLKPVDSLPGDQEKVFFGAWVTLENEDGQEVRHRIVGSDEFDPGRGWISLDSPLARALLGKRMDDEVRVHTPGGSRRWLILDIAYGENPD